MPSVWIGWLILILRAMRSSTGARRRARPQCRCNPCRAGWRAVYFQPRPRHPAGYAGRPRRANAQARARKLSESSMYQWLVALHIIAVIAWMAGMLYLPRLFVYHCAADPGSMQSETFKVMERRLLKAIINPAMIVTWALGLWLAYRGGWFAAHWLQVKLVLVLGMSG